MRKFQITDIPVGARLGCYVFVENGVILHRPDEVLTERHVAALAGAAFGVMYSADDKKEIYAYRQSELSEELPLTAVTPDMILTGVLDDRGNPLASEGAKADPETIKRIARRGIRSVRVIRTFPESFLDTLRRYIEGASKIEADGLLDSVEWIRADAAEAPPLSPEARKRIDRSESEFPEFRIDPEAALEKILRSEDPTRIRSEEIKAEFVELYGSALELTGRLLASMNAAVDPLRKTCIREIARLLIDGLIRDRELLLNTIFIPSAGNAVFEQTLKRAIVAINVGVRMRMSLEQVVELCYAALVHDVGMLRIDPTIWDTAEKFGDDEKIEIARHPGLMLDVLENVCGIPEIPALMAYQVHERADGSGYPKHRVARLLHPGSFVLMISDAFAAMVSPRKYRAAFLPYKAAEKIVELGAARKFDPESVRAFLRSVGLYPVGSFVMLDNMKIGKVICYTGNKFDRPVIRLLFDLKDKSKILETINLDGAPDLKVVQALSGERFGLDAASGF